MPLAIKMRSGPHYQDDRYSVQLFRLVESPTQLTTCLSDGDATAVVQITKHLFTLLIAALILTLLYMATLYNYLLFHSLAEWFAVTIACGMFMIAWNARELMTNHYFLFIGIAYLFVALLDVVHLFTFEGMPIIPADGADVATQFWIAARYLESLSLLISPLFIKRRLSPGSVMIVYGLVFILVVFSIFHWDIFPACFREETGLTPFKKISEYVIVVILLAAGALIYRYRDHKDKLVMRWLLASIVFTIASEITFTEYARVYDTANQTGHYFKIISFYCIYKAIIESSLTRPYATLFKELKRSEQALKHAGEKLEEKVHERTTELQNTVGRLSDEVTRRLKAESMFRQLSQKCIDALESDRNSVAKEVHDSIGASLAAVKHMLEEVMPRLDESNDAQCRQIKKSVFYLADTIQETRRISDKLRPLSLEELGLLSTIVGYARRFEEKHPDIQVALKIEAQEEQIPEPLKIVIYRVLQEGLDNAGKHSDATRVQIQLKADQEKIHLEMRDNGNGFDANIAEHEHIDEESYGIQNMLERTELIGGCFSLRSTQGEGTRIAIDFPYHP